MTKKILIFLLLLFSTTVGAVELDGRIVILLVSEHRSGDPRMESVKKELLRTRDTLGYNTEDMPIVFMGFKDSDTEREYFDRLGFQAFDSPVLCVAEWGNPARFGPKRVVDYAIARSATPQHVSFIVENYLKIVKDGVDGPQGPGPDVSPTPGGPPVGDVPGQLEIVNVRFEASGKPLYMTNVGVRIKNLESYTVRNITVRFYSKLNPQDPWRLMGKKTLQKLQSGYFGTRDIVGDTKSFGLLDENNNAVKCYYRIEVENGGNVIYEEGQFVPSEGPVGLKNEQ